MVNTLSKLLALNMTMDQYLIWDKHVGTLGKKLESVISSIKIVSYLPTHNMSKLVDKPESKVLGKYLEQVTSIEHDYGSVSYMG